MRIKITESQYRKLQLINEVKKFSDEEIRKISKKYKTNTEWKRGNWSSYNQAKKRGQEFFDDVSSHFIITRNTRTNDELRKIAKKYKQKKEWEKDDQLTYQQGYRRGKEFWDDITSHMEFKEWYGFKDIYVFEFFDGDTPKAAYIGLSCEVGRRRSEHETGKCRFHNQESKSMVYKYHKKNPHLTRKFKILTDGKVKPKEAIRLEQYWENKYREDGWKILNVAKPGSLGMRYINSDSVLRKIAKKYNRRQDWREDDNKTYSQSKKRGKEFFDEITKHMPLEKYSFTNDELREIALKYNTKSEWKTDDNSSAQQAYKRGKEFWDDITSHMVSGYVGNYDNSDDELRQIAKKYKTTGEWRKLDRGTYLQAYNRGKEFFIDITSDMVKTHKTLSDDELRQIALKYNSKVEWRKDDEKTYQQGKRKGKEFWDDITSHMVRKK